MARKTPPPSGSTPPKTGAATPKGAPGPTKGRRTGATTITNTATTPVISGLDVGGIDSGVSVTDTPPLVLAQSARSSLFSPGKPGQAVVRPADLLALRIELVNLQIAPGAPPLLSRTGTGNALIILHFPPQAIAEEVFFETAPTGMSTPDLPPGAPATLDPVDAGVAPPPIRARVAGESRLVFKVPDGFEAPYTLAGVLAACTQFALKVPANALPRSAGGLVIATPPIRIADLAKLSARQKITLSQFALRSAELLVSEGPGSRTLAARISQGSALTGQTLVPLRPPVFRNRPKPALPAASQTAIELPWRLLLAPHANAGFRHAREPVVSAISRRTELWHSRLVAPAADGRFIEPPAADPQRTLRAVWALTGENSDPTTPMQADFPTTDELPTTDHPTGPFLGTLNDFDRFQITHLSSNFGVSNYDPKPLDTQLLMLSSLGGWLDARGAWEPPGLSVEEWVHRATMGRDHYVRVVYKGFLYPFGHRVALVKVSERKFHNGRNNTPAIAGNPAYLRQRMFIVVRERERNYVDPQLRSPDDLRAFQRQLPFNNVRILTAVTPNLDLPTSAAAVIQRPLYDSKPGSSTFGQSLFWPCVNGMPFAFRCVGTDIDGRRLQFELPMIFMDNSLASPRKRVGSGSTSKLEPVFIDETVGDTLVRGAETHARAATEEWLARSDAAKPRRRVEFRRQRLALAASVKSGDTAVEVETLDFGGEWQAKGNGLRNYSQKLARPVFYPSTTAIRARIAAMTQLTGTGASNLLHWNAAYLKDGFDAADVAPAAARNKGQVFVDVVAEPGMAALDFSTQGDRSGGFVMPNLKPSGLSRLTGPITGPVDKFVAGAPLGGTELFPNALSDLPLPLLFGCIPLGEILKAVAGGSDKLPRFASEASSKLEAFFNALTRAHGFVQTLGSQSGSLAQAAVDVGKRTVQDLLAQTATLASAQVAPVKTALNAVRAALNALRARFNGFVAVQADGSLPGIDQIAGALTPANATALTQALNDVAAALQNLRAQTQAATLPAGFRQSALAAAAQSLTFVDDLKTVLQLLSTGKTLFDALQAVVEDPTAFTTPGVLGPRLDTVQAAIDPLVATLAGFRLLAGAARTAVLDALGAVSEALGLAADLAQLVDSLLGEELVVRFDWKPEIDNWALPGANPATEPLFRANDKHGFLVAVEARAKKSGGAPKVGVSCSLKHFDLVLINPAAFLELNFEKIEFRIDSAAKMDVDVLLGDIKFLGPLSFVETLKDLIPLDGFSDPPYLDISPSGIDAGFSLSLPNIALGMFSLTNLSLGAGFTVPFIGQPLSVRFNFCTREQPFNLTVSLFGGGGFFGVTIDPRGVQILEAAFEFGAGISVDFGVASGGVQVVAGIYFRMEQDAASLAGYFRLGGHVSVLCIASASLELYLELRYEFASGKCVGTAELTIEVSVFMFSASVKIRCERKFAGSNGDPGFRDVMGLDPALPLATELAAIGDATPYPWREYCEAFA